MTATQQHHLSSSVTAEPLALGSGWSGQCPCGWRGPERRTFVVAEADARLHALELAYGETGSVATAWLITVGACVGIGWLAFVYLSLAAVLGFFTACAFSFVLGALMVATRQADDRLHQWDDEEPVPYQLVDEVAARRRAHGVAS